MEPEVKTDAVSVEPPGSKSSGATDRRKKQRAKNKELLREARAAKQVQKPQFGKKRDTVDKDKKIPDSEWKQITLAASKVTGPKRCHYISTHLWDAGSVTSAGSNTNA